MPAVLALALSLSACTAPGSGAATPVPSAPGSAAPLTADQKGALRAYEAYWSAFAAAAHEPSSGSSELTSHAVDPELSKAHGVLVGWAKTGSRFDAVYAHASESVEAAADRATVHDCMTLTGKVVVVASDTVTSQTDPNPVPVTAVLHRISGSWKVSAVEQGKGSCGVPPSGAPNPSGAPK